MEMAQFPSNSIPESGQSPGLTMRANQSGWIRWLPGLNTLREYQASWFRNDFVAGLVITTMLVPIILSVVAPLAAGDPQRAVTLGGMMAIVSGVVCIAAGLARLGFITELISKPIRYGYMNGIALTVMLSQIPKLLGFSVSEPGPMRQAWGIIQGVLAG